MERVIDWGPVAVIRNCPRGTCCLLPASRSLLLRVALPPLLVFVLLVVTALTVVSVIAVCLVFPPLVVRFFAVGPVPLTSATVPVMVTAADHGRGRQSGKEQQQAQ